jgi:predicted RecA/RadA family phage recombinase
MKKYITKDHKILGEFKLTDLFNISRGKGSITNKGEYVQVSAKTTKNGHSGYSETWTHEKCFTIVSVGECGVAIWHPYKFNAANNILVLEPKFKGTEAMMLKIEQILTHFISPNYRYSRTFSITRAKNQTICLPITNDEQIDWEFLTELGKKEMLRVLNNELKFIDEKINTVDNMINQNKDLKLKATKKYVSGDHVILGEFKLVDLFDIFKSNYGDSITNEGDYPLISAKTVKNGKAGKAKTYIAENCFTMTRCGAPGVAFYHPYKFNAVGSVIILKPKFKATEATMLKIQEMLTYYISPNYRYNRGFCLARARKESICLPINIDNEIDWDFLNDLSKKQYLEVLEKEKEFINEKIKNIDQII